MKISILKFSLILGILTFILIFPSPSFATNTSTQNGAINLGPNGAFYSNGQPLPQSDSGNTGSTAIEGDLPISAGQGVSTTLFDGSSIQPTSGSSSYDPTVSAANQYLGASYNGSSTGASGAGVNYGSAATDCIGSILGKYVKNYIGDFVQSAIKSFTGKLFNQGEGQTSASSASDSSSSGGAAGDSVPTSDQIQHDKTTALHTTEKSNEAQNQQIKKSAGAQESQTNFLTPVAVCIANRLLQQVTSATVQWINNGFKNPDGTTGPAYVSNPKAFFTGIADREVGGFLKSLGPVGSMLCKPFDVQVRLALLKDYNQGYGQQAQCSLSSIQKNFSNFGKGSNGTNGNYMGDWLKLTQQDSNNVYGSYFLAKNQMGSNIQYNQDLNKLEVTIGKGFLDMKKCIKYKPGTKVCDQWQNTTPGSEVQASLDRVLTIQGQRINIANSFDDIVQALISQLLKMAVGGLQGQGKK